LLTRGVLSEQAGLPLMLIHALRRRLERLFALSAIYGMNEVQVKAQ